MPRARSNWTEYETARAREFIAAGVKPAEFLSRTGRSKATAKAHLRYIDDEVYRQRVIDTAIRYRRVVERREPSALPTIYGSTEPRVVVPPDVVQEAQRRALAPRTITGWVCGDPPIGYSALDQRAAGASAS